MLCLALLLPKMLMCGIEDRLMDNAFQIPGLLFKAWLVFVELSAAVFSQELKS